MRTVKVEKDDKHLLTMIDPGLEDTFRESSNEQLAYPFEEYSGKGKVMIAIPKSYLTGEGKGYTVDLMNAMDNAYAVRLPMSRYGCPISESITFICNFDFMKAKKPQIRKITKKVGFIRMNCRIPMGRVKGRMDLISQNFILSYGKLFSPRSEWSEKTPVVQDFKTGEARLLNKKEMDLIFGEPTLEGSVPMSMITALGKAVAKI